MFIGHFAVAFGAKRWRPRISLGWLMAGAILLDLLWPIFLLLGWENVRIDPGNTPVTPFDFIYYPWSHSLMMATAWGLLFAFIYRRTHPEEPRCDLILIFTVLSHWILDAASHRADMPLAPGLSTVIGLGLWYSKPATLAVEFAMFFSGLALYYKTTRAKDSGGKYGLLALVLLMLLSYFGALFGPPPPSVKMVAWGGVSLWLLPLAAGWIDEHRIEKES